MNKKIAVIGAGTMGSGIAQVAAEAGYDVVIVDTDLKFVDHAINKVIKKLLERKVEKGLIPLEECQEIVSRLSGTTVRSDAVRGALMVVEAVFEDLDLKKSIMADLDSLCPEETILATNTSTFPITEIASVTKHPERVIGTHYFSPVPRMKLVEIIRGEKTSDGVTEKCIDICSDFGKKPVVARDIPGFIVNRFLCLLYTEAADMIANGTRPQDVDTALKLGCNWPMGMAELMDAVGVDVCYLATQAMHHMTGEERYRPSPIMKEMYDNKQWGRKTGRGFYEYKPKE